MSILRFGFVGLLRLVSINVFAINMAGADGGLQPATMHSRLFVAIPLYALLVTAQLS